MHILFLVLLAAIAPLAQQQLDRADALFAQGDLPGSVDAYLAAVKADPAAADLERILRISPWSYSLATDEEREQSQKALAAMLKALRPYVAAHLDDWKGIKELAERVPVDEAETLIGAYLAKHPKDVEVYRTRAVIRGVNGRREAAEADYRKLVELEPKNAEHHYSVGVMAYDAVAKMPELTVGQKRARIREGLAAFDRALVLKSDYMEAMVYKSLVLRQQAALETDEAKRTKLIDQANEIRARAVEIVQARKAAAKPPDASSAWMVFVVQNGEVAGGSDDDEVVLDRAPFTLHFTMGRATTVMLNAHTSDAVIRRVQPGFRIPGDCTPIVAFCGGTALAEELSNPTPRLSTGFDRFHYLFYESPTEHRFHRAEVTESGDAFFERDVELIDDVPVTRTKLAELYLLFAVILDEDDTLSADELRKVKIRFR